MAPKGSQKSCPSSSKGTSVSTMAPKSSPKSSAPTPKNVSTPSVASKTPRSSNNKEFSIVKSSSKGEQGKISSHVITTHKEGVFVEKNTGRLGLKEETKCFRTDKYDNKVQGFTHVHHAHVKVKDVVTTSPTNSSNIKSTPKINN